jgi:hypothetical protein
MANGFPILAGEQNFATQGTTLFAQAQNGSFSGPVAFVGAPTNQPLATPDNLDGIIARGNGTAAGVVGWGGGVGEVTGFLTGPPGPGVIGAGGVLTNVTGPGGVSQQGGDGVYGLGGASGVYPILTFDNIPSGDGVVGVGGNGAAGFSVPTPDGLNPSMTYTPYPGGDGVIGQGGGGLGTASIPGNAVDGKAADPGVGVLGYGGDPNSSSLWGSGVVGICVDPTGLAPPVTVFEGIGVAGLGPLSGVFGFSSQEAGVYGMTYGSASAAVVGDHRGTGQGTGAAGVMGIGPTGGHGVIGKVPMTNTPADGGAVAVLGLVEGGQPTGDNYPYAGWFEGPVRINGLLAAHDGLAVKGGNFTLTGGGTKSVAVQFRDGSHRLLYCMESPECWFEDFGEAKLAKGKAQVKLPQDFATVIKTDSYHVFLTPCGNSNGLYLSKRNRQGFVVEEQGNGKSNLTFSFRIVGKRKDVKAERFAKVSVPKFAKPPKSPAIPKFAERKQRQEELRKRPNVPPLLSGDMSAVLPGLTAPPKR